MKLELKHYAAYLPHQLKYFDVLQLPSVFLLDTETFDGVINDSNHLGTIRFLLRPLSDLTKEIEHNGEKFVPIEKLEKCTDINHFEYIERFIYDNETIELLPYWVIDMMFNWHFDIFGLIEKGLAVDINTINK